MKPLLNLHLVVETGNEVRAAWGLLERLPDPEWKILAGLAAEIVAVHETVNVGRTSVLVVGEAQAGRVLADLGKQEPQAVARNLRESSDSGFRREG